MLSSFCLINQSQAESRSTLSCGQCHNAARRPNKDNGDDNAAQARQQWKPALTRALGRGGRRDDTNIPRGRALTRGLQREKAAHFLADGRNATRHWIMPLMAFVLRGGEEAGRESRLRRRSAARLVSPHGGDIRRLPRL